MSVWKKIDNWGTQTQELSNNQINVLDNIAYRVRTNSKILDNETVMGIRILDTVITKAPELLYDIDELNAEQKHNNNPVVDLELVKRMVAWDRKNKRLKDYQFTMMWNIVEGEEVLTDLKKKYCLMNFHLISKYGFKI